MALSGMAEAGGVFAHADGDVAQPLYFILHIPKCAGRTIQDHLKQYARPGTYYGLPKRRGLSRAVMPAYDDRKMPDPNKLVGVGGHHLGVSLESRFAGRPIRRTVLLRDPLSRAVSYYNFRMMRYRSKGQGVYDFELAYRAAARNSICHFLLNKYLEIPWVRLCTMSAPDKYDLLNRALARFWYVADYRHCDDLVVLLAEALDVPKRAVPKNVRTDWERHVDWTPLTVEDLSPALRSRIVEDNILDQLLWESWREAGHDTAEVRPRPLPREAGSAFIVTEALRPWYQARRRLKRAIGAVPAASQGGVGAQRVS